MKVQTNKTIDCEKVRNICIDNDLYTSGDCKSYENMLYKLCKGKATDKRILEIATDIYNHSNIDRFEGYTDIEAIENIMWHIYNKCLYIEIHLIEN